MILIVDDLFYQRFLAIEQDYRYRSAIHARLLMDLNYVAVLDLG